MKRLMWALVLVVFFVIAFSPIVAAAEEEAEKSSGLSDVLWTVASIATLALAGTGIGALANWIKSLSWVKKFNIDGLIDKAAELAVHYVEGWAKTAGVKGAEKLNKAKEVFQEEMARQGIKLDAGAIEKRLEGIFNKIKDKVEHK